MNLSPGIIILIDNVDYVALVDSLTTKTRAWEQDCDTTFTYDGVPLLSMLDEYMMLRHDREEEKRRLRVSKSYYRRMIKFLLYKGLVITRILLVSCRTRKSSMSRSKNKKHHLDQHQSLLDPSVQRRWWVHEQTGQVTEGCLLTHIKMVPGRQQLKTGGETTRERLLL